MKGRVNRGYSTEFGVAEYWPASLAGLRLAWPGLAGLAYPSLVALLLLAAAAWKTALAWPGRWVGRPVGERRGLAGEMRARRPRRRAPRVPRAIASYNEQITVQTLNLNAPRGSRRAAHDRFHTSAPAHARSRATPRPSATASMQRGPAASAVARAECARSCRPTRAAERRRSHSDSLPPAIEASVYPLQRARTGACGARDRWGQARRSGIAGKRAGEDEEARGRGGQGGGRGERGTGASDRRAFGLGAHLVSRRNASPLMGSPSPW